MTRGDIMVLCEKYKLGDPNEDFVKILYGFISLGDENICIRLATEFEVATSTITRWAMGKSRPHPRIAREVVRSIKSKL